MNAALFALLIACAAVINLSNSCPGVSVGTGPQSASPNATPPPSTVTSTAAATGSAPTSTAAGPGATSTTGGPGAASTSTTAGPGSISSTTARPTSTTSTAQDTTTTTTKPVSTTTTAGPGSTSSTTAGPTSTTSTAQDTTTTTTKPMSTTTTETGTTTTTMPVSSTTTSTAPFTKYYFVTESSYTHWSNCAAACSNANANGVCARFESMADVAMLEVTQGWKVSSYHFIDMECSATAYSSCTYKTTGAAVPSGLLDSIVSGGNPPWGVSFSNDANTCIAIYKLAAWGNWVDASCTLAYNNYICMDPTLVAP